MILFLPKVREMFARCKLIPYICNANSSMYLIISQGKRLICSGFYGLFLCPYNITAVAFT
jgi:hypothetical protein